MIHYVGHEDFKSIDTASLQEALDYCDKLKYVSYDSEFKHFYPEIGTLHSMQIGDHRHSFVIDIRYHNPRELKDLLESKVLVGQNLIADLPYLFHHEIAPTKLVDTYLTELCLTLGHDTVGRDLGSLVHRYLNIELDKSSQKSIGEKGLADASYVKYAGDDIKYLMPVFKEQYKKIKAQDLQEVWALEHKYLLPFAYMAWSGITIDRERLRVKIDEDNDALEAAVSKLNNYVLGLAERDEYIFSHFVERQLDLFSDHLKVKTKWSSPKQVVSLFKYLGIKVEKEERGKVKESVDAGVIEHQEHEIIEPYLHYKGIQKICSSYGENIAKMICPSGRIYTRWKQIKHTGRISSGGKDRMGNVKTLNMQNIPGDERHRSCFIAAKGNVLVQADYSQQENIILADFSEDPDLMNFFLQGGGDLHSFNAQKIFPAQLGDFTLDEIKEKFPDLRKKAKSASFAIAYGGSGVTIAQNLRISKEEGNAIYDAYMEAFPHLPEYFERQKTKILQTGYVITNPVSRRKSYYPFFNHYQKVAAVAESLGWWDRFREMKYRDPDLWEKDYLPIKKKYFAHKGTLERMSLNYPIQGTAADMVKEAGIRLFEEWSKNGHLFKVRLPLKVHDEIIVECPKEMADDMAESLQKHMEDSSRKFLKHLYVKAKPIISDRWEKG